MSGFGKVTIVGEYFNQRIVNVLHYRSSEWLPGAGNPFDDVLAFVSAVWNHVRTPYLNTKDANYTCLRVEGVGYDDAYNIVTSSPLVLTVNEPGGMIAEDSVGAALSCNIGLRCGEQHLIAGALFSQRNRGYISVGPVGEARVDNYSHVTSTYLSAIEDLAETLDDTIMLVNPAVTLTPIRIHRRYALGVLTGLSYSDVLGYTLPRTASFRRSRMPEA